MKILVDAMPESAEKCKLHGPFANGVYTCRITGKKCPLVEGNTCRVLKTVHDALNPYLRT